MNPIEPAQKLAGPQPTDLSPAALLLQLITGFFTSQAINVAAELGLADYLAAGMHSISDLAQAVDAHEGSLYRLLRALASVGVVSEVEPQHFDLTEVGYFLQTDVPGSLRALSLHNARVEWDVWRHMLHSIKTGETALRYVHGLDFFEYMQQHPHHGELFDRAMTGFVSQNIETILAAYDFTQFKRVVDVGGGHGTLMSAVLNTSPHTQGVVFDLPSVVMGAKQHLADAGLDHRCAFVGGDFFQSVPAGGDVYLLVSIIHDWDDERSITILKNCRQAMAAHGKVLIVERSLPPGNTPSFSKLLDLEMLVSLGGQERTDAQYRDLMAQAGLTVTNMLPTPGPLSIVEACI